jgi:PIN domain nuclease of toxin-antitoxin system
MGRSLRLLLDTHTYYWWIYQENRLPPRALKAIKGSEEAFVSLLCYWELAIKVKSGKMQAGTLLMEGPAKLPLDDFLLLGIEFRHISGLLDLPLHHRDPFDRLLIAQAKAEKLTIVSSDAVFDRYGVDRIW